MDVWVGGKLLSGCGLKTHVKEGGRSSEGMLAFVGGEQRLHRCARGKKGHQGKTRTPKEMTRRAGDRGITDGLSQEGDSMGWAGQ